jgi:FAD/FMN-containing dehydrogenase
VIANGVHLLPAEMLDDVFAWAQEIGPRIPRAMEMMLLLHRGEDGEVQIALTGPVLMDSEEEAREALGMLETCPGIERAIASVPYMPASLDDLYTAVAGSYPERHRYAVDNMWTHAPVEQLLPGLHRIAATLPAAPSHMLWMNWCPPGAPDEPRPDMAYSVEDETYIALYAVWSDPAEDAVNTAWATERMREMEPQASGIQLADENLGARPARFVSDENLARLDAVRATYDPGGLFHPWMGRPW